MRFEVRFSSDGSRPVDVTFTSSTDTSTAASGSVVWAVSPPPGTPSAVYRSVFERELHRRVIPRVTP